MSGRPAQFASVLAIGLLAATALAEPGPNAAPLKGAADADRASDRWQSAWRRQQELEHSRKFAEALGNARAMLADPARTSEQTALLRERVAFDLFNLDRVDEAVRSYDRQIADAVDHPTERFALLEAKAQQLLSHAEAGRAIAACRDFRAATRPNSEAWQTATAMLALALARAGDHRESIALRSELLKSRASDPRQGAALRVEIARSEQALGDDEAARASLDRAEQMLGAQAPPRAAEGDDPLRDQIERLRESLRAAR